jgi:hypothetical protein
VVGVAGGSTYCALASLYLMDPSLGQLSQDEKDDITAWCMRRQVIIIIIIIITTGQAALASTAGPEWQHQRITSVVLKVIRQALIWWDRLACHTGPRLPGTMRQGCRHVLLLLDWCLAQAAGQGGSLIGCLHKLPCSVRS